MTVLSRDILDQMVTGDGKFRVLMKPYEELVVQTPVAYWTPDLNPKLAWLTRPIFWLLTKLGCGSWRPDGSITFVECVIDPEDIISTLIESIGSMEFVWRRKPARIFIGRQQLAQILRNDQYSELVTMHDRMEGSYHFNYDKYRIDISVIPWMDGLLIV
jgi:hypothetical protein